MSDQVPQVTCAICGAPENAPGAFVCNFICPHGSPAFEFAQRTSQKIVETLTQENARLWGRVRELQAEVEVWKAHTKEGGAIIEGLLSKTGKFTCAKCGNKITVTL